MFWDTNVAEHKCMVCEQTRLPNTFMNDRRITAAVAAAVDFVAARSEASQGRGKAVRVSSLHVS